MGEVEYSDVTIPLGAGRSVVITAPWPLTHPEWELVERVLKALDHTGSTIIEQWTEYHERTKGDEAKADG